MFYFKRFALMWVFILAIEKSLACTTFTDSANNIFAKNFDWHQGHGLLVVNKRGWDKEGLAPRERTPTAKWRSQYNSISFNQMGQEFPYGGVNQAGLSVEILWLDESDYSDSENLPIINELQWVQLQLDTAANVDEAIQNAKNVWLYPFKAKVHYFICDLKSCAVFEFEKKKLLIHQNLPIKALANDFYDHSIRAWKSGDQKQRFSILAQALEQPNSTLASEQAFALLDKAKRMDNQWKIVFDKSRFHVDFQMAKDQLMKSLDYRMALENGDCREQKVLAFDLETTVAGPIDKLLNPLTDQTNAALIDKAHPLLVSKQLKAALKGFPKTRHCTL